jgi:hypothetical protein
VINVTQRDVELSEIELSSDSEKPPINSPEKNGNGSLKTEKSVSDDPVINHSRESSNQNNKVPEIVVVGKSIKE